MKKIMAVYDEDPFYAERLSEYPAAGALAVPGVLYMAGWKISLRR